MNRLPQTNGTNGAETLPLSPDASQRRAALQPLLLDLGDLVELLRRSEASLERDLSADRLPAPVWLGGSRRWRYSDIVAWTEAGCPDRREFEALQAVRKK